MIINQTSTNPNFTSSIKMRFYTPDGNLIEKFDVSKTVAGKIYKTIREKKEILDEFIKYDIEFNKCDKPQNVNLRHIGDCLVTGKTADELEQIGKELNKNKNSLYQLNSDADEFDKTYKADQISENIKKSSTAYATAASEVNARHFNERIRETIKDKNYKGDLLELQVVVDKNNILDVLFKKFGSSFSKKLPVKICNNISHITPKLTDCQTRRLRPTRARGVFRGEDFRSPLKKIKKQRNVSPEQLDLFK